METIISRLLEEYEEGHVTRRQLIQSVALAASTAAGLSARDAHAAGGFTTIALDHISYQVADYNKTRDFYADLLGMKVRSDNGKSQCSLGFGDATLIARNHREDSDATGPKVDHIAYKIADWDTDRVKGELQRRGLDPRLDNPGGGSYVSFLVNDPDGFTVQISGDVKPGDSMYKKP